VPDESGEAIRQASWEKGFVQRLCEVVIWGRAAEVRPLYSDFQKRFEVLGREPGKNPSEGVHILDK